MERVTTNSDSDMPDVANVPVAPPLTTTTSIRPAMTVLVVGALILLAFVFIDGVFGSQTTTTTPTIVVAGGLEVSPSNAVLADCILPSNPPEDIKSSYIVPTHTILAGTTHVQSNDPGNYDCTSRLFLNAPQAQVLGFYQAHLEALGWKMISSGLAADHGGEQLLFEHASSDTFYWVAGITIQSHTATSATWNLRFYQNDSFV